MRPLLPLALLAACYAIPHPDEGWVPVSERGGLTIEARGLEDSTLPRIRGTGRLAADPLHVVAVFADVARSSEWIPHLVEARYLVPPTNGRAVVYQRGTAPVPFHLAVWDRDVVLVSAVSEEEPGLWRTTFTAAERDVPLPEKVVRIPRMDGEATVRALGDGTTELVFEVEVDAGGGLPDAVQVYVVHQLPDDMLRALERRIEATRGNYDELIARWRGDGLDLSLLVDRPAR